MKRCLNFILLYFGISHPVWSKNFVNINISDKTFSSINNISKNFVKEVYDNVCPANEICKRDDEYIPLTLQFGKKGKIFTSSNDNLKDMTTIKNFYAELDNYKLYIDIFNNMQLQTEELQDIKPECEIKDYMTEKEIGEPVTLCNLFFNCYDNILNTAMAFYINANRNDLVCIRKNDDSSYLWYYKTKNNSFAEDIRILFENYPYNFQCRKASYCISGQNYDTDINCNCVLQAKEFLITYNICSSISCRSNERNIENHYEGRDGKLYHKKDDGECKK